MAFFEKRLSSLFTFRTTCCAVLLCSASLSSSYASENEDFFDKIKVAFTYRIIQFVELTEDASSKSPINICVFANDKINRFFLDYESKEINEKEIQILFLDQLPHSSDQCYVLYIGNSEQARLPQTLKQIASLGKVLTVSDIDQFAKLGGMVELKIHENNIKMEINVSSAMNVGIRFSSKLLEVANIVKRD